ncbi:hypothetical protein K432DRAFT_402478 [Lepidopterella palustris CBS 459.81]|uniref:NadR/Ttd14 AAA domain-containing protein n=1 Tax=Lepidopterella palustris CBS 459.81 TaxID=1314670 RepID=A0A8E2EF97_9PEZI|nr:hypothetical protein K432DRAFT_402478 [Lepidopterella palustris CBS 459.81]
MHWQNDPGQRTQRALCSTRKRVSGSSNLIIICEVARTVLNQYDFPRGDITSSPARAMQLQQHIIQAQLDVENAACSTQSPHWYISDRSGIDPIAYTHVFVGEEGIACFGGLA